MIEDHERLAPNIHGLAVLPDDELTRFPFVNVIGTVTADPNQITSTLEELGERDLNLGTAANGVRLLNLAIMTSEPLAQMVLAVSSFEELRQNQKWSTAQKALIERLAKNAERSDQCDVSLQRKADGFPSQRKETIFPNLPLKRNDWASVGRCFND